MKWWQLALGVVAGALVVAGLVVVWCAIVYLVTGWERRWLRVVCVTALCLFIAAMSAILTDSFIAARARGDGPELHVK